MVAKGPFYVKILVTCCWIVLLKLTCETVALLFIGLMLAGCFPSRMGVQAALPLVESQILAMQEERDPELAKQAIPANLKTLEGLLKQDPFCSIVMRKSSTCTPKWMPIFKGCMKRKGMCC